MRTGLTSKWRVESHDNKISCGLYVYGAKIVGAMLRVVLFDHDNNISFGLYVYGAKTSWRHVARSIIWP
jgi:hypothetical protein